MANSLDVRIVEDGRRNAVVKIVGVADTADINQVGAILLTSFLNNEPNMSFTGFKLVEADYSGTPGLLVQLFWDGNTQQPMVALSTSGDIDARRHGGFVPDKTASGYNGNINLVTRGFTPGSVYGFTLGLRMVKMYS